MNCTDCRDVVSAALDGEAARDELEHADGHLAACAECRRYRDEIGEDRSALSAWPDESPAGLDRAMRARTPRRLAAAAALIAAIGAGFLAGRATSPRPTAPADGSVRVRSVTFHESSRYYPARNEMHSTVALHGLQKPRS